MVNENVIFQVLAEQKEETKNYDTQKWVSRKEESLFEFDSKLALAQQTWICGKSVGSHIISRIICLDFVRKWRIICLDFVKKRIFAKSKSSNYVLRKDN